MTLVSCYLLANNNTHTQGILTDNKLKAKYYWHFQKERSWFWNVPKCPVADATGHTEAQYLPICRKHANVVCRLAFVSTFEIKGLMILSNPNPSLNPAGHFDLTMALAKRPLCHLKKQQIVSPVLAAGVTMKIHFCVLFFKLLPPCY